VTDQDLQKMHLNKRLEAVAWGLFLIMIGGLWLLPEAVPEGTWLFGVGIIMLGLNGVRKLYGIKMSGFTISCSNYRNWCYFGSGFADLSDPHYLMGFECSPRAIPEEKT
jgi:membrane-bound ClpP family serine protease